MGSEMCIRDSYNPTTNEICFPAGILQPPFFDPEADDAVNYGAIGAVIGHEMTHGFDDQGCQFDKTGQQRNWWTAADKTTYEKRTKVLEDYFSGIEVINGKKINGKQTLGENIGDNGGLHVALRAMHDDNGVAGDIDGHREDYFNYLFQKGAIDFSKYPANHVTAMQQGKAIRGMTKECVRLAKGEPARTVKDRNGREDWIYPREGVVVKFDKNGKVM